MNDLWLVEERARNSREGHVAVGLVVGLLVVVTRGVGKGSIEHCDPVLVFSMMVLGSDSGYAIWYIEA